MIVMHGTSANREAKVEGMDGQGIIAPAEHRHAQRRSLKGDEEATMAVYSAIRGVLLSGRIPSGQKLQEPAIARSLGVSRERVRRALHRLAHEGWVQLIPNRGAFLRVPSIEEIEEISEARRIVETATVEILARRRSHRAVEQLRRHIASEARAHRNGARAERISLSGAFHLLITELAGNRRLLHFQNELLTASQLFYAISSPLELPRCGGPDEHPAIVEAIAAGDARLAKRLMDEHLREILVSMKLAQPLPPFAGFDTLFDKLDL